MTIFIAGHGGMVGSAIKRKLEADGVDVITCSRAQVDLRDQAGVRAFIQKTRPDAVVLAAAKVGGIYANNTYPAEFIYDNLMIQNNVIHEAYKAGIQKLLFLGSSCIYPREAPQPMKESSLLTGTLEPTNEPYAIAKIAGIKMCESYNRQYGTDYRSVMPTNLYGPGDNFHPENSHALPGLLRRFHEAVVNGASEVVVWGSGKPRREFLHVDDMAAAAMFVMNLCLEEYQSQTYPNQSHLNVGYGEDISIAELAELVAAEVGFTGKIIFDPTKPDGTPRKLMDVSRLNNLGWKAKIDLQSGIASTYDWYKKNISIVSKLEIETF